MRKRQSRMPKVGDLIVEKSVGSRYFGIVTEIIKDLYGHQKSVYIEWSGKNPPKYNEEHGYAGVNIHNCRSEFDVIRSGHDIP